MRRHYLGLAIIAVMLATPVASTQEDPVSQPLVKPKVPNKIDDRLVPIAYANQRVEGILGEHMDVNVDQGILEHQPWYDEMQGEYIGKCMHTEANMYQYTKNEKVLEKLKARVKMLLNWQNSRGFIGHGSWKEDGYEYDDAWIPWNDKYEILGLVAYHALTGDQESLEAAIRIAHALDRDFGFGEDDFDLMESGSIRLGSASMLEPMVYLYRYTGDGQILDFCNYIMEAHEKEPNGTRIVSEMLEGSGRVDRVGGPGVWWQKGKAYEMLSCYVGLVRMYQLTGEYEYLDATLRSWEDVREDRLYITGSTSFREFYGHDNYLPGDVSQRPCEACVTAHWLFLNRVLFYLTGEGKFADEMERTVYNHLLGSHSPHTSLIESYCPLVGNKKFRFKRISPPCCITSLQREIARLPEVVWAKYADNGIAVVLLNEASMSDTINTPGGEVRLNLSIESDYPNTGAAKLRVSPATPSSFRLALRVPAWCSDFVAFVNGTERHVGIPGTFLDIQREWSEGDIVRIEMDMNDRVVEGSPSYLQHYAVLHGPMVMAVGRDVNPSLELADVRMNLDAELKLTRADDRLPKGWFGGQAYTTPRLADEVLLVPFANVGQFNEQCEFTVWIPASEESAPWKVIDSRLLTYDDSWEESFETQETMVPEEDHNYPYFGGSAHIVEANEAYAEYTFEGTGVTVHANQASPGEDAQIDVYVDSELEATVDLPNPRDEYRPVAFHKTGLASGEHTLRIVRRTGRCAVDFIQYKVLDTK